MINTLGKRSSETLSRFFLLFIILDLLHAVPLLLLLFTLWVELFYGLSVVYHESVLLAVVPVLIGLLRTWPMQAMIQV